MVITDEIKEKNLSLFFKKLAEVTDIANLESTLGSELLNATFSTSSPDSLTGDGTLINTILRLLTPMAIKLNNALPEEVQVDQKTLIKICLLHHISKAVRLLPNDNEWEVSKRGIFYKYDESNPSIRTGLHSLVIAQQAGISFTPEEAEAMTINDRDLTDDQARWHSSMLATIIRMANELVYQVENNKSNTVKE